MPHLDGPARVTFINQVQEYLLHKRPPPPLRAAVGP